MPQVFSDGPMGVGLVRAEEDLGKLTSHACDEEVEILGNGSLGGDLGGFIV